MHATRFARGGRWRVVGPKSARSRIGAANPGLREIPKITSRAGWTAPIPWRPNGRPPTPLLLGLPAFWLPSETRPDHWGVLQGPRAAAFSERNASSRALVDTFGPSRESRDIYPARILSPAPARQDLNPLHEPNHHPALGCSVVAHSSSWPNLFLHDETGDYGWTVNRASTDLPAPRCVSTNACTPSVRAR